MDYIELLNSLPSELEQRKENLKTKLINNSWSNVFNEIISIVLFS